MCNEQIMILQLLAWGSLFVGMIAGVICIYLYEKYKYRKYSRYIEKRMKRKIR